MTRTDYIIERMSKTLFKIDRATCEKEYRRELRRVYSLMYRLTQV